MLEISYHTLAGFEAKATINLSRQLLQAFPALGSLEVARSYINEAMSAGIDTDQAIAEFTMLLHPIDMTGRPEAIDRLVKDPEVDGSLKLFQIGYALHGERP